MKEIVVKIYILSNLNMIISIRVRFKMDGRMAVCNLMKYQIVLVQTVKRILIKKSTLFCLLLFLFCIFTVFSIGCLHEICGFKLIEFSYIVCLEVSILSIAPRI